MCLREDGESEKNGRGRKREEEGGRGRKREAEGGRGLACGSLLVLGTQGTYLSV